MQQFGSRTDSQHSGGPKSRQPLADNSGQVRVLAQVPWIGAAEPNTQPSAHSTANSATTASQRPAATQPVFNFVSHSVLATTDRAVEEIEERAPTVIVSTPIKTGPGVQFHRFDQPAVPVADPPPIEPIQPDTISAPAEFDDYLPPDAIPGKRTVRDGQTAAAMPIAPWDQPAPGWAEVALALYAAVIPHARWLVLMVLLAIAGLILLVLHDANTTPEFTAPSDFAPIAASDHFNVSPPSTDEPVDSVIALREPIVPVGRRPDTPQALGPGEIARRASVEVMDDLDEYTESSPDDFAATTPYPTTGLSPMELPAWGTTPPPQARIAQPILRHSERAEYENNKPSVH